MVLDSVIGHDRAKDRLRLLVERDEVPQALLFTGPEHVGKATLARAFAQMLQCEQGGCGGCPTCRMVAAGTHLDTIFLVDDGETLSIEQVRELRARLALTGQARVKLAILEDVGRLSPAAEGALLKTLEEPTPKTHFLLTAPSLDDVLPTIRSRVTVVPLTLATEADLVPILDRAGRHADRAELLFLADGRPGLLLQSLADDAARKAEHDRLHDAETVLVSPSLIDRCRIALAHSEEHADATAFLRLLLLVLRRELIAGGVATDRARIAIPLVLDALRDLRTNARPRLLLEDVVVHLPVWDRVQTRSPST